MYILKGCEGLICLVKYTRARSKECLTERALTDHIASKNHTIDWEGVRLLAREPDWKKKGVKEAIFIRKAETRAINWDRGCQLLPEVFSKLLCHEN